MVNSRSISPQQPRYEIHLVPTGILSTFFLFFIPCILNSNSRMHLADLAGRDRSQHGQEFNSLHSCRVPLLLELVRHFHWYYVLEMDDQKNEVDYPANELNNKPWVHLAYSVGKECIHSGKGSVHTPKHGSIRECAMVVIVSCINI